jgi:hypothetical protein
VEKSEICKKCAVGLANPLTGKKEVSFCVECDEGSYNGQEGKPSCTPCIAGLYGDEKKQTAESSCKTCAAGHIAAVAGQKFCKKNDFFYYLLRNVILKIRK